MRKARYLLTEDDVPEHWYNVLTDLPFDVPQERKLKTSVILQALTDSLVPQLPLSMYRQSIGGERFIPIPGPVREQYQKWRPTPLHRARDLELELDTPAHIYYKYEGINGAGSHKLNSALAQAYYYSRAGVRELTTGTGAGQWGTALSMACQVYGLKCTAFMVRASYRQKPYRRVLMELNGARVIPSASKETPSGRRALEADPDSSGSLAIANAEAIEYAYEHDKCRFAVGSGENHVLLHQTVIGEEAVRQMAAAGEFPDVVIAAMGAGSNFGGIGLPFYREKLARKSDTRLLAVEPTACPKLTRGVYAYDYSDQSGITPMTKMYTLGHKFKTAAIHAGGLRYHGAAPILSAMYAADMITAKAYGQRSVFDAAKTFVKCEGIVPAPESAHAIRAAIDEALVSRTEGKSRTILLNISGHGLLDLSAYDEYLAGQLPDYSATSEEIAASLAELPEA